jgi:hypothetical protein
MPNQIRNPIADVTEGIGIAPKNLVQFTSTPESIYFFLPSGRIVSSSVCENNRPSRKLFPRVPRAEHLPHDDGGWLRDYSVGCPAHRRGANAMLLSGDIARG